MGEAHLTQAHRRGKGRFSLFFLNKKRNLPTHLSPPPPHPHAPLCPHPKNRKQKKRTETKKHFQSPHFLTLCHLPESQVQHFKAGELCDPLQSPLGDLGTSIQVDACQLGQVVSYELQPFVRDAHTLSNVQGPQFMHLPHHPVYPVVGDVTRAQGQGLELVQPLGDVRQGLVPDLIAEGDVKPGEPQGAHGEVHGPRVADIVTGA